MQTKQIETLSKTVKVFTAQAIEYLKSVQEKASSGHQNAPCGAEPKDQVVMAVRERQRA